MSDAQILPRVATLTYCVTDHDAERRAWASLGLTEWHAGTLGPDLCAAWDAPADAACRTCLMQPPSGEPPFLRFVETERRDGTWPPLSWGWHVTEILAADPDALAERLEGTAFQVFLGPVDLLPRPKSPRVVQAYGPSGQLIYFTRLLPNGSRYGISGARTFVDRPFKFGMGGPSLDALIHFYGNTMGLKVDEPTFFPGTLATRAAGASPDTIAPISVARVELRRSILELDEFPDTVKPRPRPEGALPGGLAMIGFEVEDLDALPVPMRAPPRPVATPPYDGRRVAAVVDPAGERLEIIESRRA
mgnify:CR=1 FL=1